MRCRQRVTEPAAAAGGMSTRAGYDLCLVHADDAGQWSRYVLHHLGRDHFRFRLVSVTAGQLVGWLAAGAWSCVGELADSAAFVVVVSPALVELLVDQPSLDFTRLVRQPRNAQVRGAGGRRAQFLVTSVFSARCNIYISRLCHDASPSVRLSVTEVHWRIIANLGFKFRSHFTAHWPPCCWRAPCCSPCCLRGIISRHASQC